MKSLSRTANAAVDAYGGIALWRNANHIEAEVSVKGLAFTLKRRPLFDHSGIVMNVHEPVSCISPIGNDPLVSGILEFNDVRLKKGEGKMHSERKNARTMFTSKTKLFRWDDLDMAYFANYAFWNYFTLPALLLRKDIKWEELTPGVLDAEFPDSIPTHSRFQRFIFDKHTGLLKQHNYTADIISKLAKASNVVLKHSVNNGIIYPSSRRVTPRFFADISLGFPELINIQVHRFSVHK